MDRKPGYYTVKDRMIDYSRLDQIDRKAVELSDMKHRCLEDRVNNSESKKRSLLAGGLSLLSLGVSKMTGIIGMVTGSEFIQNYGDNIGEGLMYVSATALALSSWNYLSKIAKGQDLLEDYRKLRIKTFEKEFVRDKLKEEFEDKYEMEYLDFRTRRFQERDYDMISAGIDFYEDEVKPLKRYSVASLKKKDFKNGFKDKRQEIAKMDLKSDHDKYIIEFKDGSITANLDNNLN